jgi:hypothetical protein
MLINRKAAHAPRSKALCKEALTLPGPCLNCEGCRGICMALVDAMTLPETILKDRTA